MRILWLNEYAEFIGGCEAYVHQTAKLLNEKSVESVLLYSVKSKVSSGFAAPYSRCFPAVDLEKQITALNPDLIYIHRWQSLKDLCSVIKSGVPTVRFYHDHKLFCLREHKYKTLTHQTCTQPIGFRCYPCLGFVNRTPQGIRLNCVGKLRKEHKVNHQLDAYVTGSHYMAGHLKAHGFDPGKTYVIPLYAEPVAINPGIKRRENHLLFVGQLIRGKGLDTLLEALAMSATKPHLTIIGTGRQEEIYRTMVKKSALEDRVEFLGRIPNQDIHRYYQETSAVVFPVRTPETFGLVGAEAMRFATPVIASFIGGVSEWLEHEKTGIAVPPNDPKPLAKAIDRLLNDRQLRQTLGENGKKTYQERFTPQQHVDQLFHTFLTMTGAALV